MSRHFIIFILLPYSWPDEFIISVRRSLICIPLSGIYILSDEVYRLLEHDPEDRLPAMADAYCRGISTVTVSKPWGAYETLHGPTAAPPFRLFCIHATAPCTLYSPPSSAARAHNFLLKTHMGQPRVYNLHSTHALHMHTRRAPHATVCRRTEGDPRTPPCAHIHARRTARTL